MMKTVTAPSYSGPKVRFRNGENNFFTELRQRVDAYFEGSGRARTANFYMHFRTAVLLAAYVGNMALILLGGLNLWAVLGLLVLQGALTAAVGFNVAHDAIHGSYSSNPWVNRLLSYSMNLIGGSSYVWSLSHNIVHHTWTNVHGVDDDLVVASFIRLSPHQKWRKVHRYQHLFAWPVYGLATIFWVTVKDFKKMADPSIGPLKRKHPAKEWAWLVFTKAFYFTYSVALPLVLMDITWWQFLIGYAAWHLTAGIILGVVFQLAHVVEETGHPVPSETGDIDNAWAQHQLATTHNFARKSGFLAWYVGGLNFQIEHHLFPKICSVHYPALSKIVKETADKHGVPYLEHNTMRGAVLSHYRALRMLGNKHVPVGAFSPLRREEKPEALAATTV